MKLPEFLQTVCKKTEQQDQLVLSYGSKCSISVSFVINNPTSTIQFFFSLKDIFHLNITNK